MPAWLHTVQSLLCSLKLSMVVDSLRPNCRCLYLPAGVHIVQILLFSHTVSMDVDEVSDQIVDMCQFVHGSTLSKVFSAPIQ